MEDDIAIRNRLANDERPLKRCLQKYTTWSGSLSTTSPQDIQLNTQLVIAELQSFAKSMSKYGLFESASQHEISSYQETSEEIERNIDATSRTIEELRDQLVQAQEQRRQRLEYDEIAKDILKLPSRESLQQTVEGLQNEIRELQNERESRKTLVTSLRQQFDLSLVELEKLHGMVRKAAEEKISVIMDDISPLASPSLKGQDSMGLSVSSPMATGDSHQLQSDHDYEEGILEQDRREEDDDGEEEGALSDMNNTTMDTT
ncbi:hypothetical protein IWQ62_006529 [Dispira parvispora]|uniref:THO complex subunit 7 n=1 Tax=Dispira parvispora TaxID=1520584 RepID=A0A9W8E3J4_9FUNG|nr:hypothetical protein IWQ62_006529 [Dispira parvispora]